MLNKPVKMLNRTEKWITGNERKDVEQEKEREMLNRK